MILKLNILKMRFIFSDNYQIKINIIALDFH